MSLADIQSSLQDLYGVEVSSSLISSVTTAVLEEVKIWQSRPLDALYPILYLDCIVVKVREEHRITNKSVYLALGINTAGRKELVGMWICANEGSKFWLHVLTELNNRGLKHIYIACDCCKIRKNMALFALNKVESSFCNSLGFIKNL